MNVFFTVVLTYVLNYAAYFAEIYRGGINSIDRGQYEAAFALGISRRQTMTDIVMPQTMKAILPPVVNEAERKSNFGNEGYRQGLLWIQSGGSCGLFAA